MTSEANTMGLSHFHMADWNVPNGLYTNSVKSADYAPGVHKADYGVWRLVGRKQLCLSGSVQ